MKAYNVCVILLLLSAVSLFADQVNTKEMLAFKSANNVNVKVVENESDIVSIIFGDTTATFTVPDLKQLEGILKIHLDIVDGVVKEKLPYVFNRDAGKVLSSLPMLTTLKFVFRYAGKGTEDDCAIVCQVLPYGRQGNGPQVEAVFSAGQVRDLLKSFNDSYAEIDARRSAVARIVTLTDKANSY